MFIIDAHLDLAMNAMEWNRDLRLPVTVIREAETGMSDKPDRAKAMVSLDALRKGNTGLVVATQIARYSAPGNPLPGWNSPEQAWAQTQAQLTWYREMEKAGEMIMISNLPDLETHIQAWNDDSIAQSDNVLVKPSGTEGSKQPPIGFILSLEGADSLVNVDYLHQAHAYGLRAVGPAHYGPGRYANGTDSTGKMQEAGISLLKEMEQLNMILDATHLCDDAFWQAMDLYSGPIWASHNNCRALVDHNRQFSDDMIRALIKRGAVIGGALDAWMMVPAWQRGVSEPEAMQCNLEKLIDHLVHICSIAGNTNHIGIGSDLDGAFGKEQTAYDLDTIADLQLLTGILMRRGFTRDETDAVMHKNWLRFLRQAWA